MSDTPTADQVQAAEATRQESNRAVEEARRQAWRDSPEGFRARRGWWLAVVPWVLWTIGLIVVALSGPARANYVFQLIALTLFFIGTYITVYGYFFYRNFQRRAFEGRMLLGDVSALQQEEKAIASAGTDFDSLWAITQKRIDLYHEIAAQQSRNSFRSGQIAAYSGFIVIIVVAGTAAFTSPAPGP